MTFQTFMSGPEARQRYWARSFIGWRTFSGAAPNGGHRAVTGLERAGLLAGTITQNVDGLHQASGAAEVIDLHGSLSRVICTGCGDLLGRDELDRRFTEANDGFAAQALAVNPDGDVELADEAVAGFRVVDCTLCRGVLKPDVVFFGESVPAPRVAASFAVVEQARSLLVLGSSLTVMSGRRFVLRAAKRGIPIGIVNQGPTRGDVNATFTLDAPLGTTLSAVLAEVAAG
jgi:NAD-dependent SIR2 family protein deacetylase